MRLGLKHIHPHAILRMLCMPAYIFAVILLIKLAQTPEVFWEFLRTHKGAAIFSLIVIMTHTAQELVTALEDYIPNHKRRTLAIKMTVFLSAVSVVIIAFALWRV
jgi:hypothetical protein